MKYSVVAMLLAVAVNAQSRDDIPKCALGPLDEAIASESDCEVTDIVCVCKNFTAIRSAATAAILEKCGTDVALNEVLPAAQALCENPTNPEEPEEEEPEEEEPEEEEPTEEKPTSTKAEVKPTYAAPADDATTTEAPEKPTSAYNPLPPTPTTPGTVKPTVITDGAAGLSGMGVLAALGLAAIAL